MPSILFVLTSCDTNLVGKPTGYYLPEAAHPYYILTPTCTVDFASPKGPNPPLDQRSVTAFEKDEDCVRFLKDPIVADKLSHAKKLSEISAKDYDAVFYVGGHGPVIDLPTDEDNIRLASEFYQAGKITSAVCHGPAALANAVDAEGKSIFAGKNFTGFSNAEEVQVDSVSSIPFSLEDDISKKGGIYSRAEPWQSKVVVDGHLLTGQNPASAAPLANAILEAL
ncbi:class I glutamine amidotransferase-like protein [Mucidula mucida]|nr:class I glutamine amidotransferase-like protein [Mucidula mucida]